MSTSERPCRSPSPSLVKDSQAEHEVRLFCPLCPRSVDPAVHGDTKSTRVLIPVCGQPHKAVLTWNKGVTYRRRRYATCKPIARIQDSRDQNSPRAVEKAYRGESQIAQEKNGSLWGRRLTYLGDGMTKHIGDI